MTAHTERVAAFLDALPRDTRDTTALTPGRTYTLTVQAATNKAWTATYTGELLRVKRAGATLVMHVHGRDVELPAAGVRTAREVTQ